MSPLDDIPERALALAQAGLPVALATVIETWGSAPRPVGAQMLVDGAGDFHGSVSGGCVEGAVVEVARAAMAARAPRIVEYGVADEDAFAVGLACGGRIRLMVEPIGPAPCLPVAILKALVAARGAHDPVALGTDLQSWEHRLGPPTPLNAPRFAADQSGTEDGVFVAIHNPPLRLLVVGAVHVAQALVPMARTLGYAVSVSDPRSAFAAAARFPGEDFLEGWTDEAVAAFAPDARSAVVTLSHDPKIDTPALIAALATPAFYIGALGSKRTHQRRVAALGAAGLGAAAIARIHAPIGADIGAKSPAEIAVSILAEMTERLRRPATRR